MFKKIGIAVAGAVIGAGALYAYNRFIGGASADDYMEYDDDVEDEESTTEK